MSTASDTSVTVTVRASSGVAEDATSVSSRTSSDSSPSSMTSSQKQTVSGKPKEATKLRELLVLPKSFDPSDNDVIIGRGKRARTHEGNTRLRGLIAFMIPEYQAAGSNKDEKSFIIKEIVMQIRKSSPNGGFVKFDKATGRWVEVGCFLAREKISQTFRDAMGDSYSSSNPYKRKRRSFEKKHNAIVDIIKRRRGTSPTSVSQSGASSPPSPPSPESYKRVGGGLPQLPPVAPQSSTGAAGAAITPITSTQQQQLIQTSSANSTYKSPGQIGFARRGSMQMGMSAGQLRTATTPQQHQGYRFHPPPSPRLDQAPAVNHLLLVGTGTRPVRHSSSHFAAARSPHSSTVAGHALFPHGVSCHRSSSLPAAYDPALMSEMIQRQRLARNAAMMGANLSGL